MTECTPQIELFSTGRRMVTFRFDGEQISSNAGVLLASEVERKLGLIERMAEALSDLRDSRYVRHDLKSQMRQRVLQIAAGYADANDSTSLRYEPALQTAMKRIPGEKESVLASQPTMSRFEQRSPRENARMGRLLIDVWVDEIAASGQQSVTLDFDTTDDPTHGAQQLAFFHPHYDATIYHPLLVFDGHGFPIVAMLRPGNAHGGRAAISTLRLIIKRLRRKCPNVAVLVRADAGFAMPEMYTTCEKLGLTYLIAQTVHSKYKTMTEALVARAKKLLEEGNESVTLYDEYVYQAKTWRRSRRVIAKAECSSTHTHVRYVVTNIVSGTPEEIYKKYSGRGQAENHIKDLKNAMFADRLSCSDFWANQFRLLLHTAAYVILHVLRRELDDTSLKGIQLDTLRGTLVKVGAAITVTARRIWVRLSSADPSVAIFNYVARRLAST